MLQKKLAVLILLTLTLSCNRVELTGTEEEQIQQYIEINNLTVTESTPSGLRYIRTKERRPDLLEE